MSEKPRTWIVREKAGGIASILVADPAEDLISVIELEPVLDEAEATRAAIHQAIYENEVHSHALEDTFHRLDKFLREHGRLK